MLKISIYRHLSWYLMLLCLMGINACATHKTSDCEAGKWESSAYSLGREGEKREVADAAFQACNAIGSKIDQALFSARYEAGLEEYCVAENGYKQGEKGRVYQHVCPTNLEPDFLVEYQRGYAEFRARKKIENLQRVDGSGRDQVRGSSR